MAIDCVWLADPESNDWDTAANWSSGTVPGYGDSVFFGQSDQTQVSVNSASDADNLTFQRDADAYEIDIEPSGYIDIGLGTDTPSNGIHNLSQVMQTFVAKTDASGGAGYIGLYGNDGTLSTFITEPAQTAGGYSGYILQTFGGLQGRSIAGTCVFINQGGIVAGGPGGMLTFDNTASAGHANITNQAATVSGGIGGLTTFDRYSGPAASTITNEGAQVAGAAGGMTQISSIGNAPSTATLIAEGGSNGGGGGVIQFNTKTGTGTRIEVFGNGTLDLAAHNLNVGSVEGDGLVTLNGHLLRIGDNNLDTTFSGSIQDSGSIAKVGTGSLTLDGVSTYGGSTFVDQGALIVNSQSGSGTSRGPVMVTAGTLGGYGVIQGPVTIGQGNGAGSFLAPSFASTDVARLVIRHALTFKPDGTYICKVGENNVRGDQVQADQVTINTGAQFSLEPFSDQRLPDNTVFMVIDNVSLQPIDGTFANLADGLTITVGENNFLVNYEGGDGNDLTLTVVP